ncbi:MAG TPA: hypothetical protein VNZ61_02330 [Roseomonas sp.]|nr:hypothetical protein [Roseomonas sp.]
MMTLLTFSDQRTKLGGLMLDVLVTEEINLDSDVTQYPVEDGTLISDHITQGAERIRISGLVSTADMAVFSFGARGRSKLIDAIDTLRAMHKARALVTVSTGVMLYRDMAFTSMRAVRSSGEKGGSWLEINAELTKVRKVTLKTAEVPEAPAQGAAKGRAGKTNTPAGKSSGTSASTAATGTSGSGPAKVTPLYRLAHGAGLEPKELLASLKSQLGLKR